MPTPIRADRVHYAWVVLASTTFVLLTAGGVRAAIGVFIVGFSSILTGLNFIVTIHRMRAPGLTWMRMPLFLWATYATALINVLGIRMAAVVQSAVVLVILIVGVNGTGKTTSVGKLAWLYRQLGKKVLLGAADTYRAAAVEQLSIWAERCGVDIVKQQHGADPAAVAYDAVQAAQSRGADVVLLDTAGRLHTAANLMQELQKIRRVVQKVDPAAPHETLLVLDANTGQNGLVQAREFTSTVEVSGLFLAKLDGTAKGGIVIAIKRGLGIPVQFVGVGESLEDIEEFDAASFAEALVTRGE